jgi:hypothetical protein
MKRVVSRTAVTKDRNKIRVRFVQPMLALAVTKLPEGPAWTL